MNQSEEMERTSVKTYVPAYQKEIWEEDADDLEMSLSEFMRSMVQAGRDTMDDRRKRVVDHVSPGGSVLETHLLELLREEPMSWDELHDEIADELAPILEETLDSMKDEHLVEHGTRSEYIAITSEASMHGQ